MNRRLTRRLLVVALVALAAASVGVGAMAGSAAAQPDVSTAAQTSASPTAQQTASTAAIAAAQTTEIDLTANFTVTYSRSPGANTGYYRTVTLENPEVDEPNDVFVALSNGSDEEVLESTGLRYTSTGWRPITGAEESTLKVHVRPSEPLDVAALPAYNEHYDVVSEHEFSTGISAIGAGSYDLTTSVNRSFATETFRNGNDVFVGPHTNVTVPSDHGTIKLVVPKGVDIEAGDRRVPRALAELSANHDFGRTHDEILAVPVRPHDGAGGRAHILDHWFWTGNHNPVNTTTSAWNHEFMHMTDPLQDQDVASDASWYSEAYASWYASLRPLEAAHDDPDATVHERLQYAAFRDKLEKGATEYDADLTNVTAWADENSTNSGANYDQGLLTIGAIDRQIRLATGGDATFADVMQDLDQREGTITHEDLLSAISAVSGDSDVVEQADAWITGEEIPDPWTLQEHTEAFGYGIPDVSTQQSAAFATTERGTLSLDDDGEPTVVDPDDGLTARVTHTNDGTADGRANATLEVDGELVDSSSATVRPGQNLTQTLGHAFETSGYHALEYGSEQAAVVAIPDDATLIREDGSTSASDPATIRSGESLALLVEDLSSYVDVERTDGTLVGSYETGDEYRLATVDAADLDAGTTYRIQFPIGFDGDTDTQYVEVAAESSPEPPTVELSGVPSGSVTTSDTVELAVDVTDQSSSVEQYDWSFGDGTTATGATASHSFDAAGTYDVEVTVTDANGLEATASATIAVESAQQPHGEIDPTATSASVGESVSFGIDQHTDYISQMQWSMGDGTTYGTDYWVNHAFDSPGTYTVTLETKSGYDGSWTTDTVTIEVN